MKNKNFVLILSAIIIFLSCFVYSINFWGTNVSKEAEKWAAFSDYLNPFIASANLIVVFWFSLEVYRYNERRDRYDSQFKKGLERPILISKSSFIVGRSPQEIWEIVNIGNGAALNLKICFKTARISNWKLPSIKCFSLAKDENIEISWATRIDVIGIIYEDVFGNKYTTICADDESYTQPLNGDFLNINIVNFEFTIDEIFLIETVSQRLHWAKLYGINEIK